MVIKLEKIINGKKYQISIQFSNNKKSIFDLIINEINNKQRKELEKDDKPIEHPKISRNIL